MKVKVLKPFRDKYTKELYKTDRIIDIKADRVKEILKTGPFVEKIK